MYRTVLPGDSASVPACSDRGSCVSGFLQTIMNHLWFGKSLKEATDSPVVFVDSKNELKFEPSFDKVMHHSDTRSFNRLRAEAENNQSNQSKFSSQKTKKDAYATFTSHKL